MTTPIPLALAAASAPDRHHATLRESFRSVSSTVLVTVLQAAGRAGVAVCLWGAPGIGKSALIHAAAAADDVPCETRHRLAAGAQRLCRPARGRRGRRAHGATVLG